MLSRRLTPRAGLSVFYVVRAYSVPVNPQVPRKKKVWNSLHEAVSVVKAGDVLLSGGTLLSFNNNRMVLNAVVRLWPLWDTRWVMRRGSRNCVQPGRTP